MNGPSTQPQQDNNAASDAFATLAHPALGVVADGAPSELVAPMSAAGRAACRLFMKNPVEQDEARRYVEQRLAQVEIHNTELAKASLPSPLHLHREVVFAAEQELVQRELEVSAGNLTLAA